MLMMMMMRMMMLMMMLMLMMMMVIMMMMMLMMMIMMSMMMMTTPVIGKMRRSRKTRRKLGHQSPELHALPPLSLLRARAAVKGTHLAAHQAEVLTGRQTTLRLAFKPRERVRAP